MRQKLLDGARLGLVISILASLRDATSGVAFLDCYTIHFNPRIPAGCDRIVRFHVIDFCISILASLRDATDVPVFRTIIDVISILASLRDAPQFTYTTPSETRNFNPRIPAGCDCTDPAFGAIREISILASLRDATMYAVCRCRPERYFNPRIPAGCDSIVSVFDVPCSAFQSSHPCGMRLRIVGAP